MERNPGGVLSVCGVWSYLAFEGKMGKVSVVAVQDRPVQLSHSLRYVNNHHTAGSGYHLLQPQMSFMCE